MLRVVGAFHFGAVGHVAEQTRDAIAKQTCGGDLAESNKKLNIRHGNDLVRFAIQWIESQ
ncbi:hypothetical protein GNZ13_30720 [Paraburkholderia sp. 5N]|uniref:Uncharacterized protein n=1 Tax=Paraburkholderia elongata TaxID=2675747 RepID=A0A972SL40_9BURK|nr:hypothetical protein [Paraburkholderia elongata]